MSTMLQISLEVQNSSKLRALSTVKLFKAQMEYFTTVDKYDMQAHIVSLQVSSLLFVRTQVGVKIRIRRTLPRLAALTAGRSICAQKKSRERSNKS